jgi:hypothetical protein
MAHATDRQLADLVRESATVRELDERVSHQFGPAHIPGARLLAVREKGAAWVFGPVAEPPSEIYKTFRVLGRPTSIVLWFSSCLVLLALAWPPFALVHDGGSWHIGFSSIFGELNASRRGSVNVPLLAIELICIAAVGAALFFLAQRIERRGS